EKRRQAAKPLVALAVALRLLALLATRSRQAVYGLQAGGALAVTSELMRFLALGLARELCPAMAQRLQWDRRTAWPRQRTPTPAPPPPRKAPPQEPHGRKAPSQTLPTATGDAAGAGAAAAAAVAPSRALEAVRHVHLLTACALPALRLLRQLLAALATAGMRLEPPAAERAAADALLDLQAALAFLPVDSAELVPADADGAAGDVAAAARAGTACQGPTSLVSLALRGRALVVAACRLWCPPAAWATPLPPAARRGGLWRGSFLQHLAAHTLAAPAHHHGGARLLADLLPGEAPFSLYRPPRGLAASLLPLPGLGADIEAAVEAAAVGGGGPAAAAAAGGAAAFGFVSSVAAIEGSDGPRAAALRSAEAAVSSLMTQWDVVLTSGLEETGSDTERSGDVVAKQPPRGGEEEVERAAAEAAEASYEPDGTGSWRFADPLLAVTTPRGVNVAAVVATLAASASPPLADAAAAVARRAVECGPRASRAVASGLVRLLVGCIERYLTATQVSAQGKDAPGWETVCRVLLVVRTLAVAPSGAGRVALLAGGAMGALVPCLGLPKPEVIRLALDVLTCLCGGGGATADVLRYAEPPMPFSTLVTAVRNVVAKWHRVDLHVHASGARLLAQLGAEPGCARDVLQGLWPRGNEAADGGTDGAGSGAGKTSMLLPRLYGGLQKGFEDLSARYRNRMLLESEGQAAKGEELDRRALRLARAACWALQLPLALTTEGLVDAAEVYKVLAPPPPKGVPRVLADEPLTKLAAAAEAFRVLYRGVAAPLEGAAAATGDRALLLQRLAQRQYMSALAGSLRELAAACDAVRGSRSEAGPPPAPPAVAPAPLARWFDGRALIAPWRPGDGGGGSDGSDSGWEEAEAAARAWLSPGPFLGVERLGAAARDDNVALALFYKTEATELAMAAQRGTELEKAAAATKAVAATAKAPKAAAAAAAAKRGPVKADEAAKEAAAAAAAAVVADGGGADSIFGRKRRLD
ncbi:unnamed protein product, partial [Phaeothamnion confervicola]